MAKILPNSNTVIRLMSIAILISGTLSIADAVHAQGSAGLSYEEALKALQKTKKHSQAAKSWGERRTISVPKGVDPNAVIKQKVIKVPGVEGIDGPTSPKSVKPIKVTIPVDAAKSGQAPVPQAKAKPIAKQAPSNQTKSSNGWDWVSSQKKTKKVTPILEPNEVVAKPVVKKAPAKTVLFKPTKPGVSSMKTVYEAPVTKKPKSTSAPVPLSTSDNLLDAGTKKAVTTAQAQAETKPVSTAPATTPSTRQSKESASNFYNRAVKAHLQGKLSEAIADYSAALRADPKFANAHCNLGQIYNQQHHFDMAIAEFRKALAINPKDEHSYNGIGASLRGKKDYAGAIKNWKQAVSLKPDLATAHYNLGAVYEVQKDYDHALLAYEQAVKHDYRLGEANYRMGIIMTKKNRLDEAKQQISKALEVSGKASYSADARKLLAKLEEKTK